MVWFEVEHNVAFIYPHLMQLYACIDRAVGNGDYASDFGAWMFGLSSPLVFVDGIIFPLVQESSDQWPMQLEILSAIVMLNNAW